MIRRGLFDGGCGWVGHRVGWMLPGMGGGGGMVSGLITTSSVKQGGKRRSRFLWKPKKAKPLCGKPFSLFLSLFDAYKI